MRTGTPSKMLFNYMLIYLYMYKGYKKKRDNYSHAVLQRLTYQAGFIGIKSLIWYFQFLIGKVR